jgi:hypothetical protein
MKTGNYHTGQHVQECCGHIEGSVIGCSYRVFMESFRVKLVTSLKDDQYTSSLTGESGIMG